MKTKELFDLGDGEDLNLSFKKADVPKGQIKSHWLKVLKKMKEKGDNELNSGEESKELNTKFSGEA